jgi:glycosyltransferase involved in cell wall biosynthesis
MDVIAIIPAYNEGGRIGKVLAALREVSELEQIIAVDDGSTDSTVDDIRQAATFDARIRLLSMSTNQGKGQAVLAALSTVQAPYILMLDADLVNLAPSHIRGLIDPVSHGTADMTLGLFRGGHFTTDLSHWGTPWLTGQRCMKAELFGFLNKEKAGGYALEIALTVAAQRHNLKVRHIPMRGVWHPSSAYHRGLRTGLKWHINMVQQIWRGWIANDGPPALKNQLLRSIGRFWHDPLHAWPAARKRLIRLKQWL